MLGQLGAGRGCSVGILAAAKALAPSMLPAHAAGAALSLPTQGSQGILWELICCSVSASPGNSPAGSFSGEKSLLPLPGPAAKLGGLCWCQGGGSPKPIAWLWLWCFRDLALGLRAPAHSLQVPIPACWLLLVSSSECLQGTEDVGKAFYTHMPRQSQC